MIQVLDRAFDSLELLATGDRSLTELAEATGVQRTTLRNILRTLEERGVVGRSENARYTLGPTISRLAETRLRGAALLPIAQRAVNRLAEETGETVSSSILKDGDRYVLANAIGWRDVTVRLKTDGAHPPYDTTTGRVMLAYLPQAELERVITRHGLPDGLWEGVTSRDELNAALQTIREAGQTERTSGETQTLAMPIFAPDGTVPAAVGIHMPASRYTAEYRRTLLDALRRTADVISRELAVALGATLTEGKEKVHATD
jgi:DNA-binding IclR family transcriptional regulator